MESMPQFQETVAHEPVILNEHDVDWLAAFNILPDTPNQPHFINTLNKLNQQGSIDLRSFISEAFIERRAAVLQARHDFFALMGLSDTMAKAARYRPTLLQPELFITLQRELYMLGLDGPGITKKLPYGVLGRDSTIIRRTFEVLQELSLKSAQVINRFPSILGYSEEAIQARIRYLEELSLKPIQVIHRFPSIFGLSKETIQAKIQCLEELGLKPVQVINHLPNIFGLSEETIQSKVRCLEELGLKPIQIINSNPAILGVSEKMLRSKVAFLRRTVKLLKWEYTAEMLLNIQPTLLGYNFEKLQILRILLAHNVVPASRYCPPSQIGNASIVPLEAYIIVLADMNEGEQFSLEELARQAKKVQNLLRRHLGGQQPRQLPSQLIKPWVAGFAGCI